MYIDAEHFDLCMEKLSKKLTEIAKNLSALVNTTEVFEKDDKILDNQDLCFLLKMSNRSLQRYRAKGELPHFFIGHRVYYRTSDVRAFVNRHCDYWQIKAFENGTKAKED
ncbi:hypothetical protein EZS27_013965 [termite gut metagenome]|uniref:Helix-turn-helix domain-containing protein n=1 Tax=termite gut metagenome TaxID=433724 RepID=A0A5J4RY31_9ZZZZ